MNFYKTLFLSLLISLSLSGLIIYLTSKDIPPYEYELKYVENPIVLETMIRNDSSLNTTLQHYGNQHNIVYDEFLKQCINYCNIQRAKILKNNYYSTRDQARKLHISQNAYINQMCIDSLKQKYK